MFIIYEVIKKCHSIYNIQRNKQLAHVHCAMYNINAITPNY